MTTGTPNIVTYAEDNLQTFAERPFCEVDSLVLSWCSYLRFPAEMAEVRSWEGRRLADLFCAEHFSALFSDAYDPRSTRALFTALAASPRFRDAIVCGYRDEYDDVVEKQFSATVFRLGQGLNYVAYRGTDATIVGWKEDFNMALRCPVPAQARAAAFLDEAADHCPGRLMVGGHSKGGNLAVYAASHCAPQVRGRVLAVFSHDGPGFREDVLQGEGFRAVAPIVRNTVPQSSVVGMLLDNRSGYRVVKSSRPGILQHDPFSWVVEGTDFVQLEDLTATAKYLDRTITGWVKNMDEEELVRTVEALFGFIEELNVKGAVTTGEFWADLPKNPLTLAKALQGVDPRYWGAIVDVMKALLSSGAQNAGEMIQEVLEEATATAASAVQSAVPTGETIAARFHAAAPTGAGAQAAGDSGGAAL